MTTPQGPPAGARLSPHSSLRHLDRLHRLARLPTFGPRMDTRVDSFEGQELFDEFKALEDVEW